MDTEELKEFLILKTQCEEENITIESDDNGEYVAIDEFEIRDDEDGNFTVTDPNGTFEDFATSGKNILQFFIGWYDAYSETDKKAPNEYYDLGYAYGEVAHETELSEEEEEEEEEQ